ncbi:hypothetical protein RFI_23465 [Reticulomyxa filosa]|uniref:TauD/TfdA-like domain-containing protein n=1 Tax=Reticulomyxa filosa TaxID=46433 RepID=X6MLH9_RETFI|nr:hypothetical protein RFI_23465 [Reticulomyxa filosa]|eukprot:ETO13900.1 hypothetical protein RFI_23465 [Reticulomyxa filosa]
MPQVAIVTSFVSLLLVLCCSIEQTVEVRSDGSQSTSRTLLQNRTGWQGDYMDLTNMPDLPTWCMESELPQQKVVNSKVFPLVLTPSSSNVQMSAEELFEKLEHDYASLYWYLVKYGSIFFRNFPLKSAANFDEFVKRFKNWEPLPYIGGAAVRNKVHGNVYTTNESPPDAKIPFHHEMAQTPNHPYYLFFYCQQPPTQGGETPILSSYEVYERAKTSIPQFIDKLQSTGVRYVRHLPDSDDHSSPIGRSWKSTFLTDDKHEAERKHLQSGGEFEWLPDNVMKTTSAILPAIRWDNRTAHFTFFNSIVAAYTGWNDSRNVAERAVIFGDGSPILPQDIQVLVQIMNDLSVAIPWQFGDVMLIDNKQVMHSRKAFTPPRDIYAALCK